VPKPLQQSHFHKISRAIKFDAKHGHFNAEKIAKSFGVSRTTVSTIKRVKTWPGYQANLLARHNSPRVTAAEKQLVKDLAEAQENPVVYVTVEQFTDAIKDLQVAIDEKTDAAKNDAARANRRLSIHFKNIGRIDELLGKIQARKPHWFRER